MNDFDQDTVLAPAEATPAGHAANASNAASADDAAACHSFNGRVQAAYNIGANPNGGYLLALAVAALRQAHPGHPDTLSATVHYLRPGLSGQPCRVDTRLLRGGRSLSTVQATLVQDGSARLALLAAMGDVSQAGSAPPPLALPLPQIPPPEQCPGRSADAQGVALPLLDRLDIRLHPDQVRPGLARQARVSGWIRFRDGRPPDALACLLFADAFPPAVFGLLGMVGWVPTVELTLHLRARPAPGWMLGEFWSQDLADGRVIEDGALWDSKGRLVLQVRQLALVRQAPAAA